MSRLEEIMELAKTQNLTIAQLEAVPRQYYFGCERYTDKNHPFPGLAGAMTYLQEKNDAGFYQAARYISDIVRSRK